MNISVEQLRAEYEAARNRWPWLAAIERRHMLPSYLLFAVGSRETGLSAEYAEGATGDDGHGHGVWQLDDRWHEIPEGFDTDARMQAETAAAMLADLIARYGAVVPALNAYNSGSPEVTETTGGDYGPDVWERRLALLDSGIPVLDIDDRPTINPGPPPELIRG